ncbi:uncharacterized protein LOC110465461 [Mizuhopecten yessoensis]|uniref:Zinc finger protein 34 n=1 Tax=Mizuhopecten yessoensis TaxID=6573 RepID=A0A210PRI8_MIZYE|nr:uncharacterized protein LOC110465461 [Mizuhopecten yessoensis]OWF39115.1 Zinc finger protein 34 [Mizuhopecten yessoensis]
MEASIKRTSLVGDIGLREEEVSSDTENRNDNDVFHCGKCELQFQCSYQLHHHIAYTHAGITMDTAERLPNPYPVEPLALNLKHSNRVDSPIVNKSREPSPLSKPFRKSLQSVALDLSKPPSNSGEALDLSTTKLPSFREGEVTTYRSHQGEATPSNDQSHSFDQTTFGKRCNSDLGKAAADDMVKSGQFLVDNSSEADNLMSGHNSEGEDENHLVIDCSSSTNNFSNEEINYEPSHKDSLESNILTKSQFQFPYGKRKYHMPDNGGQDHGNRQGQHHPIQSHGQQSDNQGQVLSPQNQSQGHLLQSEGQGLSAGADAGRFNGLSFPFSLQQHLMMMNGSGASPPNPNYNVMPSDMQQSLMSFQQQLSPFMQGKPGPVKAAKVSRRSRVKATDLQVDKNKTVVEIYECKVCNRKFSQVGNFHNHMKLHSTKVCVCGICKVEFLDSYELQRHMRKTHTGDMPYKCEQCDREFSQYNNLRRHLRVHNGKSYKCHICGRTFNEVFYLEMHIGSHTGERTYSCGVCSLSFSDNAELQRHVQTHSAAELHTCEVCGKSFSKACVLRQHKKMHSGLRPFKCDICDKAFIHRHHLKIHSRMHSTDKPYRCKICGKDFAQTSHLYKHVRQHAQNTGEEESDVRTQVDIQALYPGLCQGSRGTPSPLTTSGVSDLSQSSGSPINSPVMEGECHDDPSPGENDLPLKSQLSDNEDENGCNDLNVSSAGKFKAVLPDMTMATVGCEDTYKFDDGIGLGHNMNEDEEDLMDQPLEDIKRREESTASDTMESDFDTESGELSPLANEGQHDYRKFDIAKRLVTTVANHANRAEFPYQDKVSSAEHPVERNKSDCEDFSERIKKECSQMSQSMDDIKSDVTLDQKMTINPDTEDNMGNIRMKSETTEGKKRQEKNGQTVKQRYSIEHLLKNPNEQEVFDNGGKEREPFERNFIKGKIGSELHPMTGPRVGMTTDLHHTGVSKHSSITEFHFKNTASLHRKESSQHPLHNGSCVNSTQNPAMSVFDIHLSSNSYDLHQNSLRQGQGHLDQHSARLSESISPMSSDHLSTASSLETEMSRSRSSSLESEDKRSRSYKMKCELIGHGNTREEDVTSSTDDHTVSNSNVSSGEQREDNSSPYNMQSSKDFVSREVSQYPTEGGLSSDRSSTHAKPKQKRRRRQNVNKVIPPEQNYLPLVPNLGIDPQQMYLLQLHQMQMAMAASMAAGAHMYPFSGSRVMPGGNFDTSTAYSPEISHHQHFNRDRSRSQSPQVPRSHNLHRLSQEGLLHSPSISPRNKDVSHSGSPKSSNLTPSDKVTSSREEMMRFMMLKQEMASNGHS